MLEEKDNLIHSIWAPWMKTGQTAVTILHWISQIKPLTCRWQEMKSQTITTVKVSPLMTLKICSKCYGNPSNSNSKSLKCPPFSCSTGRFGRIIKGGCFHSLGTSDREVDQLSEWIVNTSGISGRSPLSFFLFTVSLAVSLSPFRCLVSHCILLEFRCRCLRD